MKSRCPSKRLRPDGASDGKADGKDGGPHPSWSRHKKMVFKNLGMMNDALPTPYGWEDDAPDGKDGSPRSLVPGPMYKVSAAQHVNVERHPRESACISLREHLGGREYERCSCLRQS